MKYSDFTDAFIEGMIKQSTLIMKIKEVYIEDNIYITIHDNIYVPIIIKEVNEKDVNILHLFFDKTYTDLIVNKCSSHPHLTTEEIIVFLHKFGYEKKYLRTLYNFTINTYYKFKIHDVLYNNMILIEDFDIIELSNHINIMQIFNNDIVHDIYEIICEDVLSKCENTNFKYYNSSVSNIDKLDINIYTYIYNITYKCIKKLGEKLDQIPSDELLQKLNNMYMVTINASLKYINNKKKELDADEDILKYIKNIEANFNGLNIHKF